MLTNITTVTDLAYDGRVSQSGTERGVAPSDGIEHPVNEKSSTEYRAYCHAQTEVCLKHNYAWVADSLAKRRRGTVQTMNVQNRTAGESGVGCRRVHRRWVGRRFCVYGSHGPRSWPKLASAMHRT